MSLKLNLATAFVALVASGVAADAQTLTRIETHAFYGATVTVEEGVRVFRPLPSTGHMIINPGGKTPLSVNLSESVHHYVGPAGGAVSGGGSGAGGVRGGAGLAWVPADARGHRGHHHAKAVGMPAGRLVRPHVGGRGKAH